MPGVSLTEVARPTATGPALRPEVSPANTARARKRLTCPKRTLLCSGALTSSAVEMNQTGQPDHPDQRPLTRSTTRANATTAANVATVQPISTTVCGSHVNGVSSRAANGG